MLLNDDPDSFVNGPAWFVHGPELNMLWSNVFGLIVEVDCRDADENGEMEIGSTRQYGGCEPMTMQEIDNEG